ncbi:aminoacyl-tRNA hydrolase [Patescibacteria group bacterium]|nr:aminoacyl-tRNA hydrolase [Patescibacteria group bacterium]
MKYLIIGLGNIGEQYSLTRHNVGFLFLDYLAHSLDSSFSFKKAFNASILNVNDLLLFKSHTFMNNSGDNISKVLKYYKISIDHIIVVYDDLDIEFGNFKIGGKFPKTHNGLYSIIENIKSTQFVNIRIGIGKENMNISGLDYVLTNFNKKELDLLNKSIFPDVVSVLRKTINLDE